MEMERCIGRKNEMKNYTRKEGQKVTCKEINTGWEWTYVQNERMI